jgi:transposase InsO family protein
MEQKIFDVPGVGRKKYRWRTFKSWLHQYRIAGFEGLQPKARFDKGTARKIDEHLREIIKQKLQQFPRITISLLYRMLTDEGHIQNGSPCYEVIRLFIKDNNLKQKHDEINPRKKFEKPHINELWLADFMHGQHFIIDNKKRKLFLAGIIDDHSRVLVAANWTLKENTEALELTLKQAITTYGLPKIFYCDNGAVFVSGHLQLVCARLGIALVHSKPYDSPARGKIERFWRTVRQNFLPLVPVNKNYSLAEFNTMFHIWLENDYNRKIHHTTLQTPLDRYLADLKDTAVRRIAENELDLIFYRTYKRKVKNDATISINSVLFEVPTRYMGTFIEVRHPLGQPLDLWIFEHEKPVLKMNKVDVHYNSNSPTSGITFSKHQ